MKITVYIPCYNAGEFISGCLESVLAQTCPPSEVIVINDASTDRTVEIALRYPVRIIDMPSHPGLAAARNEAVKAAGGDCVASIDADCTADPSWLKNLARAMDEEGASGAGGKLVETYRDRMADRWRAVHMRQNWGDARVVNPPFLFGCNTLFRKDALVDVELYDTRFRTNGEDVDLSSRLRARGHTLVYEPSAIVRHLKTDTLLSVLRADWNWGYRTSGDTAKYESNSRIVYHNFTNAKYRFLTDVSSGRYSLLPLDAFLLLYHTYLDLAHARPQGKKGVPIADIRSRVETLTEFHDHLARLSEARFLQRPDSPCAGGGGTR